jgi:hypothetical protein
MSVIVVGAVGLPSFARSHTLGLSTADFTVESGGRVAARFVFATTEPLGNLSLDRDHDGVVTSADMAAARADLEAFILQGVDVEAEGDRCDATFDGAALSEVDGLTLTAHYACVDDPRAVRVTLYYLSSLDRGHREIARIVDGSASAEAVLSADRRALELNLPASSPASRAGRSRRVRISRIGAGLLAAVLAGWLLRAWRNRSSHAGHAG